MSAYLKWLRIGNGMVTWYWLRQNGGFIVLFHAIVSSWHTYCAIPKFKGLMSHHYLRLTWIFYFICFRHAATQHLSWYEGIRLEPKSSRTELKKKNLECRTFLKNNNDHWKKQLLGCYALADYVKHFFKA